MAWQIARQVNKKGAKIADYLELSYFKQYIKIFSRKFDIDLIVPKIKSKILQIKDPIAKKEISNFVRNWAKDILKKEIPEILYESGDK
ncbi:MAG: hypothetical protein AAB661_01520 [Patescibacteria group bacterium]